MDVASESAYPTPYANSTILPLLLLSLMQQKNAPKPATSFRHQYDYVIVGAGSAGSVVASRLSEIPCVSVLLIEAGKSAPILTEIPVLGRNFWFTDVDWQFKTVPQRYSGNALVNNEKMIGDSIQAGSLMYYSYCSLCHPSAQVIWPSGKALGGSSILNAMLYVRGNKLDYNDWAKNGAVGWSASDTRPYFLKLEDNRDPEYIANGHHVVDGPVSVHKPGYDAEMKKPIFEAAKQLGYKILDSNANRQTGFFDQQGTLRNGQRCSTAKAYLVPAENRTNLDILPNAFVRKILTKGRRATGVQFDYGGSTYNIRARREVIVSAGTTNTAQLLMLSGIGPRRHLEEHNIRVVADLPVGENFHDHCANPVPFTLDPSIPNILQKAIDPKNVQEYIQNRTGPLSSTEGVAAIAFLNGQPQANVDFPNHELYFVEVPKEIVQFQLGVKPQVYRQAFAPYENSTIYVCLVQILQPKSRGTVRLSSTNPYDPPLIDPNYYEDPRDVQDVVQGMKACIRIGTSEPMQRVGSKPFTTLLPGCERFVQDQDNYLECVARSLVITLSHPVGTAKMGDPRDPTTVVDPNLRVKGLIGLRVVDASIMPTVPSGNTNVPTIMVAEKASDIIKSTIACYCQTPVVSQNEFPSSPYFQKPPVSPNVIY